MLSVLERLADLYEAAARHSAAADAARRQIALDPWRETAYSQLMHALAWMIHSPCIWPVSVA